MSTPLRSLDHVAYRTPVRLAKYNGKVTVFQAHGQADGAKILRRLNPMWTREDHQILADQHAAEALSLEQEYAQALNDAAMETFGRPFAFTDYKISAIGRSEFSEERKDKLRFAAHAKSNHKTLSLAHRRAAGAKSRQVP